LVVARDGRLCLTAIGYTEDVAAATLTERGLLDLTDVFVVGAILSVAAGAVVGRWRALLVPPAMAALVFAGIEAGWWGGGLGERWETSFVASTLAGVVLAVGGVALHLLARRLRATGTVWRAAAVGGALVAIAAFWFVSTRPPDVGRMQERAASPLYYLGDSFEGYRLTHAEGGDGRAFFAYGNCEMPVGQVDGGCPVPLELQEQFPPGSGQPECAPQPGRPRQSAEDAAAVVVLAGSTTIKIYANEPGRAFRAARALEPVTRLCS
jgi:hypothetical protein